MGVWFCVVRSECRYLKSKLGANSILAVSMAVCRAGAAAAHMPLYDYIATLAHYPIRPHHLPIPSFNIINGGAHSGNALAFQEFMILPVGASNFREAMRMASEVYQSLKKIISQRYGTDSVNVGDEGGFAPNITNCESSHACHPAMHSVYTALDLIMDAVRASGYEGRVKIALDVAASEFYDGASKRYNLLKKVKQYLAREKKKETLRPYTMDEINAWIDESEADEAAGREYTAEEVDRRMKEKYTWLCE